MIDIFAIKTELQATFFRGNGREQNLKFENGEKFYSHCLEQEDMRELIHDRRNE